MVASFDAFIKADRQKKREREKHEELATEIFGRGRKQAGASAVTSKFGAGPSLASRVGIVKSSQRSSSTPAKILSNRDRVTSDLINQTGSRGRPAQNVRQHSAFDKRREDLLSEALAAKGARNQPRARAAEQISIKGAAGPYVVVGSNFAPGTTAADIEAAMVPPGAEVQSCSIIRSSPSVVAEIVFYDKSHADAIITMFNNKIADGRKLHIYLKSTGQQPSSANETDRSQSDPRDPFLEAERAPLKGTATNGGRSGRNQMRQDPEVQDGRYGFAEAGAMDVDESYASGNAGARGSRRQDGDSYYGDQSRRQIDRGFDPPRGPGRDRFHNRDYKSRRPHDSYSSRRGYR